MGDDAAKSVNGFCLEHIMALSEQRDIIAAEDIVDDRGIKLWAKGQKVSRSLQEKLLRHKLVRPLETALTVDGGVISDQVVATCHQMIEENDLLQRISGSAAARCLLDSFRETPMPGPFKLLLTTAKDTGMATYEHSLYCVALCAGIAARLNVSDHDAQQLLLAGLIHDIGELYVDPDYIRCNAPLAPSEWKHVAAHPRVGQILIQELTTLPAAVGAAVAEHHERLDGSGYPAQLTGAHLGKLGRVLAVADTASAIIANNQAQTAARLAVALRIVPGEYDRAVCQALTEALDTTAMSAIAGVDGHCLLRIRDIVERLERAMKLTMSLITQAPSKVAVDTGGYVLAALHALRKALSATGAVEASRLDTIVQEAHLMAEIHLVSREVDWRLRNLARNVYCRVYLLNQGSDLPFLEPLIDTLDSPKPTPNPAS
ncbi:MAG: HD domain-containing protein [Rhodocyclaceae bacterium]|nr:HD domain-containing protein [Rhodocyclaceae bacterium]